MIRFLKKEYKKIFIIALGSLIGSIGIVWFVDPAGLYSGGVTGISQLVVNIVFKYTGKSINLGLLLFILNIPIIALGEATMLYCCQMGQHLGIVTINPRFIPGFHHQIGKYGLRERVTGVHSMTFEPGQILEAYSDDEKAAEVKRLFEEQARPLVTAGTDVLIPGGGIPMLLFSKFRDHFVDGTPVINGIPIVVKMAEMMVSLRGLTGQFISRTSDYVKAPDEIIQEFISHPKGL